ncbi:MAG: sugar ABC transporter ATP-binding protein [Candidatus Pseudothioglobus sp.]
MSNSYNYSVWKLEGITKVFPGVVANNEVSLTLKPGEIHGLLGENGCGKSTLIKTLCGVHQPDHGKILRDGKEVSLTSPFSARNEGIATVFQEFSVVPTLSVAENIFLGVLPKKNGFIDWTKMYSDAKKVLAKINVRIDPEAIVGNLSVGDQQLVEISKAIAQNASLIILDEPTAALGLEEIQQLHRVIKDLKKQNAAIVYISHRLDEVVELVDCITILKDGCVTSDAQMTDIDISSIVNTMVGKVGEHYPKENNTQDEVVLEVRNISTSHGVKDVSFEVLKGEVFGLGGVLGSGRTEIAEALFGVKKLTSGLIKIKGKSVSFSNPQDAIKNNLGYVPENRKFDGLFFNFTGIENTSVADLKNVSKWSILDLQKEREEIRKLITKLKITPESESRFVSLLSGGNQQKIIIARWLFADAEILIFDEPTQGIDVGSKIAVYKLINELTSAGCSVILISSDHDELIAMSDRIGIVSHGTVVDILPPNQLDKVDLVKASTDEKKERIA